MIDPGIEIRPTQHPLGFEFGAGVFAPEKIEYRTLDAIRQSLSDPGCTGPDPVYAIAMDTGKRDHLPLLQARNLLFGVVTYAAGQLGDEPVRSQGHVHKKVRGNKMSPPEVYEIWTGRAIIYMQERVEDDPGRCFAVEAAPGDIVVVPPDWAHAAISTDAHEGLTFGAWCEREYGFEYDALRAHGGLAWHPVIDRATGRIGWNANSRYAPSTLIEKHPASYAGTLGIERGCAIYTQFERNPDAFVFVPSPHLNAGVWTQFIP